MSINDIPVNNYLLKSETKEDEKQDDILLINVITANNLSELDLDQELLSQYKTARALLDAVKTDKETPLNQKAQVLNTITSLISHIIKMQESLHNVEKLKVIENTLIETLKEFPKIKEKFLKAYESALKEAKK